MLTEIEDKLQLFDTITLAEMEKGLEAVFSEE